jgi:hypothetical protein
MSNAIDHRIFGFTELGQIRANLHNGAEPDAGALYSWVWASTSRQLAYKLAEKWEQSLAEDEWDVIEQLEAAEETEAARTIDCEDCGGTGRDPGSLSPFEPEDCPACNGTGQESHVPMLARRPAGRQNLNAPARTEVA